MAETVEFFAPGNPFLVNAFINGVAIPGYYDVMDNEFYTDNSDGLLRAQFVCQEVEGAEIITPVGSQVLVKGVSFLVEKVTPDGTGILTLNLLKV